VEQAVLVKKENVIFNHKNEDQDTEKLDCKEEIANKSKEIAELKLELAKYREILVEPFHVSESFSGGSSHLISKRELKPNKKVVTAAKNRTAQASTKSCISVSKFCTYPDQAISFVSTDSYIGINKIVKRAFLLAVNSIIHASPELILMRRGGFRLNGNWEVIVLMRVVL